MKHNEVTTERVRLKELLSRIISDSERPGHIKALKHDTRNIYNLVLEQYQILLTSLKRRQNQKRRHNLVNSFGNIVEVKTLLEMYYPHLRN
jgi:hypothetical protein